MADYFVLVATTIVGIAGTLFDHRSNEGTGFAALRPSGWLVCFLLCCLGAVGIAEIQDRVQRRDQYRESLIEATEQFLYHSLIPYFVAADPLDGEPFQLVLDFDARWVRVKKRPDWWPAELNRRIETREIALTQIGESIEEFFPKIRLSDLRYGGLSSSIFLAESFDSEFKKSLRLAERALLRYEDEMPLGLRRLFIQYESLSVHNGFEIFSNRLRRGATRPDGSVWKGGTMDGVVIACQKHLEHLSAVNQALLEL